MNTHFDSLLGYLRDERSCDLSMYDSAYLRKTLEKRMAVLGMEDVLDYTRVLGRQEEELQQLLRVLVNTWTAFFRDPLAFAHLEYIILPMMRDSARNRATASLRSWCVGCSSGQEAWSLAMLFEEMLEDHDADMSYQLFATDNAEHILAQARTAEYDLSTAGDMRLRHLEKFTARDGGILRIHPSLRSRVTFECHDLLDPRSLCPPSCVYGDFDLVLCCNLLMYYRDDIRAYALGKLARCLSPDGYLMVGAAEREIVLATGMFTTICPTVPIFQSKVGRN